VLLSGEASVVRRVAYRDREVARLIRGAFVGELGLLEENATASATVVVTRDAEVAVPREGHGAELLEHPVVGPRIRSVAERRRATNRASAVGPVRVALPDGSEADLRPMWPDDWVLMDAGRDRTSRESLHQRFFSVPKLTEPTLRRLATVDYVDDFAWVAIDPRATTTPDPGDDLLGVGRYGRLPDDRDAAEIALLVSDDHQAKGLGARLLAALAVAADEHGITDLTAVAWADNRGIRRLLTRAGATWHTAHDDPAMVETRWPVADALEALAEVADLDALRELVRRALSPARG
jgi:RimJ/RimL family protein N-acetyltransferase